MMTLHRNMVLRRVLSFLCLCAVVSGCAAPAAPPLPAVPTSQPGDEDALRRLDAALERVAQSPNDPGALRDALDLVALGLVEAPPGPLRIELSALADRLAAQLTESPPPGEPVIAQAPQHVSAPAASAVKPAAAPKPTQPAPPIRFAVAERRSFEGSGVSAEYASCIDVQVIGRAGPLPGAVIGINNGDLNYQNQTDGNGYSGRCGLGASTWSVVLFWTPAGGEVQNTATTVYLSGASTQRAAVVFREQ